MSIANVIRTAAERFASRVAVQDADGAVTFDELSARVHELAAGLIDAGVAPGRPVLVLLPNSVAAIEIDLALAIGGHIRVALNPRVGEREWLRIAADCSPAALIVDPAVDGSTEFVRRLGLQLVFSTDHISAIAGRVERARPRPDLPVPDPDSLCGLHYSSGTTGIPKGAQRSHANRLASLRAMTEQVLEGTMEGGRQPVFIHAGPVIHTSGLFVLPFLQAGGRQVLLEHARPPRIVEAIAEFGGTHTALVPTVIARMLDLSDEQLKPMREMRMLAYAGAPMPVEHLRQAYQRITPNLVQYYGMVEAIPPLTVLTISDHHRGMAVDPDLLSSIGRPCPEVEIGFLLDGGAVQDGEVGELSVRGPAVSPGYHNAATRTDLGKAHSDGVLRSGDLGFRSSNGYLHLTGRSRDMIITGGYNVYPREVEEEISAIDGVGDVAVVGIPDPVWGQVIVAAFTRTEDAVLDEATVLAESRNRLPDYKRPKSVHLVDDLPLTPLGKVDRASVLRQIDGLRSAIPG